MLANTFILIPKFTFINIVHIILILFSPYITLDKTNRLVLSMLETSSVYLFRNSEYRYLLFFKLALHA